MHAQKIIWVQTALRSAEEHIFSASFINFRQISLGYSLPKEWLGNTPIQSVKLSLVARNLFYIRNNVPNVNPESNYASNNRQGIENNSIPQTRTYGINLNIKL